MIGYEVFDYLIESKLSCYLILNANSIYDNNVNVGGFMKYFRLYAMYKYEFLKLDLWVYVY